MVDVGKAPMEPPCVAVLGLISWGPDTPARDGFAVSDAYLDAAANDDGQEERGLVGVGAMLELSPTRPPIRNMGLSPACAPGLL